MIWCSTLFFVLAYANASWSLAEMAVPCDENARPDFQRADDRSGYAMLSVALGTICLVVWLVGFAVTMQPSPTLVLVLTAGLLLATINPDFRPAFRRVVAG